MRKPVPTAVYNSKHLTRVHVTSSPRVVLMIAEHSVAALRPCLLGAGDQISLLEARARLWRLVTETDHRLLDDDISGMNEFVAGLYTIRQAVGPANWQTLIADVIAPHSIRPCLHEDPLTRRAFEKPRGYPGDPPLVDLIYGDGRTILAPTTLGARLHAWIVDQSSCQSVRERRRRLATLIDRVAADRPSPRILSLACGYLREAQLSAAVRERGVAEFVAIDHDCEAIAIVEREQRRFNVTPVRKSALQFLAEPSAHGSFDLAYSAGLYKYLPDDVATAVTAAMFDILRPGGLLLIANVAPEMREIGYMEAIMDWKLICRAEAAVERLSSGISSAGISEISLTRDSCGNVIYLSLQKA